LNILDKFSKNIQYSNLMKIFPAGAYLFRVDGRTDRHGEVNSNFLQILRMRLKSGGWAVKDMTRGG
jgi:hypothetical protein